MLKINYRLNKIIKYIFCGLLFFIANPIFCQYPEGFFESEISNWDSPIDIEFDKNGRMFVGERAGKIFIYQNNIKYPILDISEEIATYGDFGMLSFVLDPDFLINGHIYIFYTVDRHHLLHFGTINYSANSNEQGATIARVTRYSANPSDNFSSILSNSRFILIGEHINTGIPLTGIYHAGGDMKFGTDGSLLISTGDGAAGANYIAQAYSDGIITNEELITDGYWRSQMAGSLNGKILRIDPNTGNGLSSNPYFNLSLPSSAQSRTWATGFRNPFRICIKPNTGIDEIETGNPGTIYVSDVGQNTNEEINVIETAGQNYGWPYLEGFEFNFANNITYNPANPKPPTIEYGRAESISRVLVNGQIVDMGTPFFPYESFTGSSIILGQFYQGMKYPTSYRNNLFLSDFNNSWVKTFGLNNENTPISKSDFHSNINGIVSYAYNPLNESLYYVSIYGKIARIDYASNANQNPIANFDFDPKYGNSPLLINFDASDSEDPEGNSLTYSWNFGDNTTGSGINPSHEFNSNNGIQLITVTLTVTDIEGLKNSISKTISLNNTPPQIRIISINNLTSFDPNTTNNLALNAEVFDAEENSQNLTYKWEVYLFHNEHKHLEYSSNTLSGNYTLATIPCDNNLYFYRIMFSAADNYGLKTEFQKDIFPNCNMQDTIAPDEPLISVENFTQNSFNVKWTNINDNVNVKSVETIVNGISVKLSVASVPYFKFISTKNIIGKSFTAQIIVRDFAGNATKSSIIRFVVSSNICLQAEDIYLSDIDPTLDVNGYGPYERDINNGGIEPNDGGPIQLNGVSYSKGLGVYSFSALAFNVGSLNRNYFQAKIGIDDIQNNTLCGSIQFFVRKDNVLVYTSPVMDAFSNTIDLNIDIRNCQTLRIDVDNANNINCGGYGVWADAKLTNNCANSDLIAPNNPENITLISSKLENNLNISSPIPENNLTIIWNESTDLQDNTIEYELFLNNKSVGIYSTNNYTFTEIPLGMNTILVQAMDNIKNTAASKLSYLYNCPTGKLIFNNPVIPSAVNDENLRNNNGDQVQINVIANDELTCGNLKNNSISLIAPETATNFGVKQNGDIFKFSISNEGIWEVDTTANLIKFIPESALVTNPTIISYTVRNTENNISNEANIHITYKCTGLNQTITSGDWHDPSIWSCGSVPTKYNEVIINQLHTINIENMSAIVKNITFHGSVNFGINGNLIIEE